MKTTTPKLRVAGMSFDHMHQGDLLRQCREHPDVEIVGICDPDRSRMKATAEVLGVPEERVYTDWEACLEEARPDFVTVCPTVGAHARDVERYAERGVHLLVEKPFAASLADADRMIAAAKRHRVKLAVNWPLRWYPPHVTAQRLVAEGVIGKLEEVHHYGGNRGPLRHGADKVELKPGPKRKSWWYQKKHAGGSLTDYLGYGATLGTWFMGGRKPVEVTAMTAAQKGLEVDEQSVTVARYGDALSTFQTRWGTFTDPWVHQPQPKCGFVLKGSAGTISSWDYAPVIRVQTAERPEGYDQAVDALEAPYRGAIEYFVHCLRTGEKLSGPLDPKVSRIGQQIVDTAHRSAALRKTVALLD